MGITAEKLGKGLAALQHAKIEWGLLDDGEYFCAGNNLLQPVLFERRPAMLKIPLSGKADAASKAEGASQGEPVGKAEAGFRLLACWNGKAAVNVYRYNAEALLMERAVGERSLRRMVLDDREDEANTIVCGVVAKLHAHVCEETLELPPLDSWFQSLAAAATLHGGVFATCHKSADALLRDPQDIVALHGDIHYDNILDSGHNGHIRGENTPDSGDRGWLAIDPKGVIGERGFDYANLFCNPTIEVAASPSRLSRQVPLIAAQAGLHPQRLLRWIIAWSGLMASWMLEDGEEPALPLLVAELALKELEFS